MEGPLNGPFVIAVFGSGQEENEYAKAAGRAIAESGHDLLTGGGGGCMNSAIQGFLEIGSRKGRSHAILPVGYPEPEGYDQIVRTRFHAPKDMGRSPFSRNLVNVAFCHGCIFLTNTGGTLTEVIWMSRLGKPCAFFGPPEELPGVRRSLPETDFLAHAVEPGNGLLSTARICVAELADLLNSVS